MTPTRQHLAGVAVAMVLGCAGPAPRATPVRLSTVGIPSGPPAQFYVAPGTRSVVGPDPLRGAIAAQLTRVFVAHHRARPTADALLDQVAGDLARITPADEPPPTTAQQFLLSHYGLVEAEPHTLVVRGDSRPEAEQKIATLIGDTLPEVLQQQAFDRFGLGIWREGQRTVVVLLAQSSSVQLEPVPRRVRRGDVVRLTGRAVPGLRADKLMVTSPDGRVVHVPVRGGGPRFEVPFRFSAGAGSYQVELVGSGAQGPTVLANFPVYCDVEPPRMPAVVTGSGDAQDPGDAESMLIQQIGVARARAGLKALRTERRLSSIARAYSQEMADTATVAHVSPRTGTNGDRLLRAGLAPAAAAENVGRAANATEAHDGFMGSPGHRANILDPSFTRLGIGVARGGRGIGRHSLYFTQIFTTDL